MQKNRALNIGILGCGRVATTWHLPVLRKLEQAKVRAIADVDSGRLQQVGERFNIERRYPNVEGLLKDSEIEAVAVCVPAQFHADAALAVLESGKHLFVEKPLALNLEDTERLMKKGSAGSQIAMVGFNLRWHRLIRQSKKILEHQELGELKLLNTFHTSGTRHLGNLAEWRKKRASGGGVLIEQAVHHFDLWRFLLQNEVEEVFATTQNQDESAIVSAKMTNGVLVSSAFSEGTAEDNDLMFYGRKARLALSVYRFDSLEILPFSKNRGDIPTRLKTMIAKIKQSPHMLRQFYHGGDFITSYENEWRHFIDCVRNHHQPECTLDDGHKAVQIMMAVLESTRLNQPVKVSQAPRYLSQ
jgi:myo-inositol 2-dehydrogenase / D-chiro-inositol 1-dehydrogenase